MQRDRRWSAKSHTAALERNQTPQTLDRRANRIGGEGARSLAAALGMDPTLQTLSPVSNRVGVAGAKSFAAALDRDQTLDHLQRAYQRLLKGASSGSGRLASCTMGGRPGSSRTWSPSAR